MSAIIRTYYGADCLKKAIQSLGGRIFPKHEYGVTVVDNGLGEN